MRAFIAAKEVKEDINASLQLCGVKEKEKK